MCTTLTSLEHFISVHPQYEDGSYHHIYLDIDEINREGGWLSCLFSSESTHEFHGDLILDDGKIIHKNVQGNIYLDNKDGSLYYAIYDQKYNGIMDFEAKGSYVDAQNMLYGYVESKYFNDFFSGKAKPKSLEEVQAFMNE
jgi:hypothetical protein